MAIGTIYKDPNSTRKYTIDWTRFLSKCAEIPPDISTSTWEVPAGLEKVDESHTTKKTVIWVRGGTIGARYDVVNRITTSDNQIEDSTLEFIIQSK